MNGEPIDSRVDLAAMTNILIFQTSDEALYRRFVREIRPDRPTQEIINDLKPLWMIGEDDAVARGMLFAELAVKAGRV